jgi:hypothetical protein
MKNPIPVASVSPDHGCAIRHPSSLGKLLLAALALGATLQATPVPPTDNVSAPFMGIYGWGLADTGISHNDATAAWLYRSKLFAFDMGGYASWSYIEGTTTQLDAAKAWLASHPGGTYCYTVCLLPGYQSTPASGTSLANGAAGLYDSHFVTLAGKLVSRGLANNTIVRLGHEFNGDWYPWKVRNATDAASYAAYWRKVVTAMRAVPGAENLKFEWCGIARVWTSYPIADAYPGDAYVDYIGVDVYDKCSAANTYEAPYPDGLTPAQLLTRRNTAWGYISGTLNNNMGAWRNFAASRGKPFTIPEWGVSVNTSGGKDNPVFIQKMYEYIHEPDNNVHYHSYFDVQAGDGHHQLTQLPNGGPTEFPQAAAMFRQMFAVKPFPLNTDVGAVGLAGGFTVETFTGAGAGFHPAATVDGFNFSSRGITGDDELILEISALPGSATAQSGAMLRQDTTANAAYVALFVANGKCVLQSRATAGARTLLNATVNAVTAPVWLKLTRKTDRVTGYLSNDGLNWTLVGDCTVVMTGTAQLGIAVGSGSTTALATTTVSEVDHRDIQTNDTASIAESLVLDNDAPSGITLTGAWTTSTATTPFEGANYIQDGNTAKGTKSVRYSPSLAQANDYDVYIRWPAKYSVSSNTPVSVASTESTASFLANQQSARYLWNHLGSYAFDAGSSGNVLVETTGTTASVIADAVLFVPRPTAVSLTAGADSYVRDGTYSLINYGTETSFTVKKDATSYNRTGYLRFDVSGLTAASLVQLQLTPVGTSTSTTATYTVEFVSDDSWSETGITWGNKPAGSGVVLGQLLLPALKVGVPVSIDITSQVLAEAAGDGLLSLRITGDVSGSVTNVSFASREHATEDNRPHLLVQ